MNSSWQFIAECLRAELAEYGALLTLLDEQQRCVLLHQSDAVLAATAAIENQTGRLDQCRRQREQAVAGFAEDHGLPAHSTLRSLLPRMETDAQPLIEALMKEVNHLVVRMRRTSRHNHLLLARVVEARREIIRGLRPGAFTRTYSASGMLSPQMAMPADTLRATS